MFGWIQNLLFHYYDRCLDRSMYDVYEPRQRQIYSYFDGQRVIKADPVVLFKRLADVGPELDVDYRVARSQSKDARKAHDAMVAKIYRVFNIKPLAEGGLTETEATELLDHFITFNEAIKKKSSHFATYSTNSEVSEPSLADSLVTENSTVCGSAAEESSIVNPEPSPTVSPSHST